jgi:RNA polymerase sigma factor (sigma-70 family)
MANDNLPEIGSVTLLLNRVKDGLAADATQALFERYLRQLEAVARGKIAGLRRAVADEEDLALTVLGQFFLGVRNGRFPRLNDRHDLWQIVLVVLDRRIIDLRRRSQGKDVGESAITPRDPDSPPWGGADDVSDALASPESLAVVGELLQQLPHENWRKVAIAKLEQYTNAEIAQQLNCSVRQVERILEKIREFWRPATET